MIPTNETILQHFETADSRELFEALCDANPNAMDRILDDIDGPISQQASIMAVDLAIVPVVCIDRLIPRKEQAKLTRNLFKRLGIKGVSVTTPNYSMASVVDIRLPRRTDYTMRDDWGCPIPTDRARQANGAAQLKIEAILGKAFPNHDDRSDSQSDYFDFCWSIN